MEIFSNKGMKKAEQKFLETTFLAVLEFILVEGVDKVLSLISDATEEDVVIFPNVAKALRDKGFIK